jgi:hypothetical protein
MGTHLLSELHMALKVIDPVSNQITQAPCWRFWCERMIVLQNALVVSGTDRHFPSGKLNNILQRMMQLHTHTLWYFQVSGNGFKSLADAENCQQHQANFLSRFGNRQLHYCQQGCGSPSNKGYL